MDRGVVSDVRRSLGEAARLKTHIWRRTARVPDRGVRIMQSVNVFHFSKVRRKYVMRVQDYTYILNARRFLTFVGYEVTGAGTSAFAMHDAVTLFYQNVLLKLTA